MVIMRLRLLTVILSSAFYTKSPDDPKHTDRANKDFFGGETLTPNDWRSQTPDLNLAKHMCHLLKTKMKA